MQPKPDPGGVRIADEVIASIAAHVACEVDGVAAMSGGIVGDLTERLGKKSRTKGVRVDSSDPRMIIDLYLVVVYGTRIPYLAEQVQQRVKQAVERMTGLQVGEVNIHIQGITLPRTTYGDEEEKSTVEDGLRALARVVDEETKETGMRETDT